MSSPARLSLASRVHLPDVWQVQEMAAHERVLPYGHALLAAQLPGGAIAEAYFSCDGPGPRHAVYRLPVRRHRIAGLKRFPYFEHGAADR